MGLEVVRVPAYHSTENTSDLVYVSETEQSNLHPMLALDWRYFPNGLSPQPFLGRVERTAALLPLTSGGGWTALTITSQLPGDARAAHQRIPIYRLPEPGPADPEAAARQTYLIQIFRRADGTGWAQWFQGQGGLLTTWHFTSLQFNPMPVGGPFGGVVSVTKQASPTGVLSPTLHCFLANVAEEATAPPATSPLPLPDQTIRDLLIAHAEDIRSALQSPPLPPEAESFNAYDSLGQRKTDFFRLKKIVQPVDANNNGLPDQLELQTNDGVVINEAVYANTSGLADASGQPVDWVELRNTTNTPISMAGWGFTISSSLSPMATFDSTVVLPARGYLLLLASGKGGQLVGVSSESGEIHLPFTLPDNGGYLALLKPGTPGGVPNTFVHRWNNQKSPSVPATGQDVSWGITYDDNGNIRWAFLGAPTPGEDNSAGGYSGLSLPPYVVNNTPGQILPDGGSVTLAFAHGDPSASIFFTTNGSWPTTLSDRYTSPITIARTTIVRAIAVEPGKMPSRSITRSFLSRYDTMAQRRPQGVPSLQYDIMLDDADRRRLFEFAPSHLQRLAFGSDPELGPASGTSSPVCANVHAAFLNAPIVHISRPWMESYVHRNSPWTDATGGEVRASFEWMDPGAAGNYRQENCGIEPSGDGSLAGLRPNVKLSAAIHFRSRYSATGGGRWFGPTSNGLSSVFTGSPVTRFDDLRIKHHDQSSWALGNGDREREGLLLFEDALHMDIVRRMGQANSSALTSANPHPRHRWVHVFFNGLYHGIYDLSEEINTKWISDHDLAALPANASSATKALYAPDKYRTYVVTRTTNDAEASAAYSEIQGLMQLAGLESDAPATGSVVGYPAWEELERRLNMANYVDSLIGITFPGREIDNATAIQQWIFRGVPATLPATGIYWETRIVNWDHSDAFGLPWSHFPGGDEVLARLKLVTGDLALINHQRFKALFNLRLHLALSTGGALAGGSYTTLVDAHVSAMHGIVAADIARWLAEPDPNLGNTPALSEHGPKRWLENARDLKATGSGSWYATNLQQYLLSLEDSNYFIP